MRTTVLASRQPVLVTALAVAVAAAACDRGAAPTPNLAVDEASGASAKVDASVVAGRELAAYAPQPPAAQAPPARPAMDSAISTMLIRRGDVSVRVDSLEPAMAALRALATRLGGVVGNVSVTAGDFAVRSATLELRIPAARFDDAMGGLAPLGKVEYSGVTAEDVAEEYVDLRARVANSRRLEARLAELLATRAGKLEEVLAVERELARVREEVERHEGRLRWLGARVATSTIAVTVSERVPVVGGQPGRSVLGEAARQAWRNFVSLVAAAIASLGVVAPAALALWGAHGWWRGRRRRSMEA